jgi:hypothetical protein
MNVEINIIAQIHMVVSSVILIIVEIVELRMVKVHVMIAIMDTDLLMKENVGAVLMDVLDAIIILIKIPINIIVVNVQMVTL